MVLQYTAGGVEFPYPVKFPYHFNVHKLLYDLLPGLLDPVKHPFFHAKPSVYKPAYFPK